MKKYQQPEPHIVHPTVLVKPTELAEFAVQPTEPAAVVGQVSKRFRLVYMYRPRVMVTIVIALLVLGVGVAARPYVHSSLLETPANVVRQVASASASDASSEQQTVTVEDTTTARQQGQSTKASSASTPAKTTAKPSTPAATPTPASAPAPTPTPASAPNTTNCLPPNPNPYTAHFITKTNSQYLQTNSYVNTSKMYAALQFAGLIDTVNSKQYVVLAMDDTQWSSFTPTQLKWMNASPANMKSVIGWQVITSCITWDGVSPVKDMANNATRTVGTLNGTVTYTHGNGGLGTFGNGRVAIWDWFTSNGSVVIAGFVNTSAIP
ncbi:hypothetical protein EYC59_05610 [Candidatus Saccharibacteria bacterium]|nr:MAG: hypothetical protein EYC59_05610 [Candidatus Saccharibacteria bacterium]